MTVHFNKARECWVYDFRLQGRRYQGYCVDAARLPVTSKSAARQAEGVAKHRAQMAPKIADTAGLTLAEVIADMQPRWKREATWTDKQRQARELLTFFGSATAMRAIDETQIRAYTDFALAQLLRVWTGGPSRDRDNPDQANFWKDTGKTRAGATVNRYLSLLRQIIKRAGEVRDPLTGRPALDHVPMVRELPEIKRRARPTPEPVLERLLALLPAHAREAVILTLYFGFRAGEVFGLTVSQVDFVSKGVWLAGEDVKDREDAFLPGAPDAMAFLKGLVAQAQERGTAHLVTFRQERKDGEPEAWRPVAGVRTAWARAMAIIEKEFGRRYRWHDLRAAFITHVALNSGPVAAQSLARHSDYDTTRAYIEVADNIRRNAANKTARRPALSVVRGKRIP
jgi:integrase